MWARHPVSSGSSWPVIVFGVSLWIGLRPLRPPQSRKRRVRCAKEPTHKPKLRASEKTHQTEGSWTRLAAATPVSTPRHGPRHLVKKSAPQTASAPFPRAFSSWCSCWCSGVLAKTGLLANTSLLAPLSQHGGRSPRQDHSQREAERGQGVSIAAAGLTVFVCHPAQARPMGSTSHTHEGRGDRCGRGGYDGQTGRWRRPGIDGKHRRCCRAGEAAAGLIRRSVW